MFALTSGKGRWGTEASPAGARVPFSARFVLPRWLRRPVRVIGRLGQGQFTPPPFAATIGTAAFLALTGVYGAWVGGHFPVVTQALTARFGFAVDEVRISGHRVTSEIDILERLQLDGWTSLVGFDAAEARDRIAGLPWVAQASVRKIYPAGLEIRIVEREPFAIWQHGRELSIIERSGVVIAPFDGGRHAALPLVIGAGAPKVASDFVNRMKAHPELASRVKGYIRVAERRWDVRLENGITVKLPERGEDAAIVSLLRMDAQSALLSRDIASVDLRLSDRVVVQLTPDAAVRREAAVKDMLKPGRKKPEKKI